MRSSAAVEIRNALADVADPAKAVAMSAYMKDHFAFFGIAKPERVAATKTLIRALDTEADAAVDSIVRALWKSPERECQYCALDLLQRHAKYQSEGTLRLLRELVVSKSWWDSVDGIAPLVGAGVMRFPAWAAEMRRWAIDENLWVRRVAIIHQLGAGDRVDLGRLTEIVLDNGADPEFFIRKAIGWALRQVAWTNPTFVEAFVRAHSEVLSPLSKREALKNIAKIRLAAPGLSSPGVCQWKVEPSSVASAP